MNKDIWIGVHPELGEVVYDPSEQDDDREIVHLFEVLIETVNRFNRVEMRRVTLPVKDIELKEKCLIVYRRWKERREQEEVETPKPQVEILTHKNQVDQGSSQGYRVTYHGREYIWDDDDWYEIPSYMKPAEILIHPLNEIITPFLMKEDDQIDSISELLHRARKAREALQVDRSIRLAERCLSIEPNSEMALAVLSASFRVLRKPREALRRTQLPGGARSAPLLTTRAAAYCDIDEWENAKKELSRALAQGGSEEAFSVLNRIKSARPDLY